MPAARADAPRCSLTLVESRTPPANLDAEKSVLGSVLLDNDVFASLEGTLMSDHFYTEGHR